MELKQTNFLSNSTDVNAIKPSERNNSDKRSIYETIFSAEDEADNIIDNKPSYINNEERKFGNVSTLDWLQTWRSTEIS